MESPWTLTGRSVDQWSQILITLIRRSVSRFQEKEKGGEMITINDNKNDNIKW